MSDITTVWNTSLSRGDWVVAGADLQSGDDLTTAIYVSLFTDRLANASDPIPDGSDDRRGWWGDLDADYPIGSRLWLLGREKLTAQIPAKAKGFITEALQWMLDDGVVSSITVTASIVQPNMLATQLVLQRPDGTQLSVAFNWAWAQID
ncbi:hypothetical protein DyAD56_15815 [Dyella sp. AD56]|uniref:phage GP46 family protein n=1 Tax=Dyella sp. AD56 TaxID=1528744 RepID=UPI000C85D684|nr:phage GP46 family protein [Dyella sp. AD56]PMQ04154.1 hypothetical protein DyAD56_15815 [Dyella sp. AD56]